MIRLTTLGSVQVAVDGVPLVGRAAQRRRLALLVLLASARERGMSRDKVLGYLWPERDAEGGRHTLSQTLYVLRRDLGEAVIVAGVDDVRLDSALFESDLDDLERAIAARDPERVASCYTGPFLDGFFVSGAPDFERWAEQERIRLETAYAASIASLAQAAAARGDHAGAAEWWRRRALLDPLNAHIALELVKARAAAGDPAAAIQHARVHGALLREELGLDPDAAITAFVEGLRQAGASASGSLRRQEADPGATAPSSATAPAASEPDVDPGVALSKDVPGWPKPAAAPSGWRSRWVLATALLAVVLFGMIWLDVEAPPETPPVPSTIVLGTLTGPDHELALAVREALRAELAAVPGFRVLSESAMRETMSLMHASSEAALTAAIALEIAQRSGAELAVIGSATPLGTGMQLVVELLDVRTDTALATFAERPATEHDVIPAVTRLARRVRERAIGVVPASLPSLPAVTTTSLEALRSYTLARRALVRLDRAEAIELGEAALVHDSLFALAHYLVADLLWYVDQQSHSDVHMRRAYELSSHLPARERLLVRARYEQLLMDRPDSALAYWKLLASSYPDEPLAYEGMRWAHRALAQWEPMAEASARAFSLDSTWLLPYLEDRSRLLALTGDTARMLSFARSEGRGTPWNEDHARLMGAVERRDWSTALALVTPAQYSWRHAILIASGRREEAFTEVGIVRRDGLAQHPPRVFLLQARAELEPGGSRSRARELMREAVGWVEAADLSPSAYARLAERAADVAARLGDMETIEALRTLIDRKDAGRGLPSYRYARLMIEACSAFARGDMQETARLAELAGAGRYYGRSLATVHLLAADARSALSESTAADSLYGRVVTAHALEDGDDQTLVVLREYARAALSDPCRVARSPSCP